LHAQTLGFEHPVTGRQMDFSSPMPEDLEAVIQKWRDFINGRAGATTG
ncbi:MAG: RNA pseudouridine synthase, partial [Bacteroidales bacterium]|nr:RNA pseudouridine synthase [Bacteroidales bacterium]